MDKDVTKEIVELYTQEKYKFQLLLNGVYDFFRVEPSLNTGALPIVHSLKSRLKDPAHLEEKLLRKDDPDNPITTSNVFERITDLAGVRVLHLYQQQFTEIHKSIMSKVDDGDWFLFEPPCAYTWDPEAKKFYTELGIRCEVKESYYTSVHYVIMTKENSPLKCEIQVRTLYEEIWGEIDHYINYPTPTASIACKEQLRVLSKLSGTGKRLADSILTSHQEFLAHKSRIESLGGNSTPQEAG